MHPYNSDVNSSSQGLTASYEKPPATRTGWSPWKKRAAIIAGVLVVIAAVAVGVPVAINSSKTHDDEGQSDKSASGLNGDSAKPAGNTTKTALGGGAISNSTSSKTATSPTSLPLLPSSSPAARASLSVQSTVTGSSISADFIGLSYEKQRINNLFFANSTTLIQLFKTLGKGCLRTSGNTLDTRTWNATGTGYTSPWIAPTDVDNLAAFAKATGWSVLYGIRWIGTTVEAAVAEAQYVAQALGDSLLALEIGNEPELYPGSQPRAGVSLPGYDVNMFMNGFPAEQQPGWVEIAQAIKAAIPNAQISGPGCVMSDVDAFSIPFAKAQSGVLSMLSHHYYAGLANDETRADPASALPQVTRTDGWLEKNGPTFVDLAKNMPLGMRFTESGTQAGGGVPGLSDTMVATLWSLKTMFRTVEMGFQGMNMHGGRNASYTPILDDGADGILGERPLYYGLLAFQQIAKEGKLLVKTLTAGSGIYAWAVRDADLNVRCLLLNFNAEGTVEFDISWPSALVKAKAGSAIVLQAPELFSTDEITLGGTKVNPDGTWQAKDIYQVPVSGSKSTVTVPAVSAVLIEFLV